MGLHLNGPGWLEDEISILGWMAYFQGRTAASFRGCSSKMPFESQSLQVPNLLMPSLYGKKPSKSKYRNPLIQDHPIQTSHFVLSAGRV